MQPSPPPTVRRDRVSATGVGMTIQDVIAYEWNAWKMTCQLDGPGDPSSGEQGKKDVVTVGLTDNRVAFYGNGERTGSTGLRGPGSHAPCWFFHGQEAACLR